MKYVHPDIVRGCATYLALDIDEQKRLGETEREVREEET